MKIKILMLFCQLFVILPMALAQESDLAEQFAAELKEKCSDVRSIVCNFVQTRSAAVLVQDVEKRGRYTFLQPYNILLAFDDGDYIKITTAMFELRQNGRTTVTKVESNPMLKSLNRMLTACISGDALQITAGFASKITVTQEEYTLFLMPQRGRAVKRAQQTVLIFDRRDMSLKTMKLIDPSGDYLQYRFSDVKYNTEVDPTLFDIR